MSNTDRKLRVFLCHASQDKPIVRELYQRLLAEGWIEPWLDEERLLPGQDWDLEIKKAVEIADAVLVCLSDNSVSKEGYIQKELRKVLDVADEKPDTTIFIIPLRIRECQPPRSLLKWHYIDYFPDVNKDNAYTKLRTSLQSRSESIGLRQRIYWQKRKSTQKKIVGFTPQRQVYGFDIYNLYELEFIKIPSGKFSMGLENANSKFYSPKRTVHLSYDFLITRYPVTNQDYLRYMKLEGITIDIEERNRFKPPKYPVGYISFEAAIDFCNHINYYCGDPFPDGYSFRLPTEQEWEKAARSIDSRVFSWGKVLECTNSFFGVNNIMKGYPFREESLDAKIAARFVNDDYDPGPFDDWGFRVVLAPKIRAKSL